MSKLYGDFQASDWQHGLSIPDDCVPEALVVHGQLDYEGNIDRWDELLGPDAASPQWNTRLGTYEGTPVGFANVLGGPMAAMTAHPLCVMGTDTLIQTGYFGGVSDEIDYGDILIVSSAGGGCGVASEYGCADHPLDADPGLVDAARRYCERQDWSHTTGAAYSTDAIFLETEAMVRRVRDDGFHGIDMETSATFAVADHHDCRAIGLLNLSDHLLRGDHLMNYDDRRRRLERETDRRIRQLAFHLASTIDTTDVPDEPTDQHDD